MRKRSARPAPSPASSTLVSPRNVTFRSSMRSPPACRGAAGGGVTLIDVDGDGDLDLFVASGAGERLFDESGGRAAGRRCRPRRSGSRPSGAAGSARPPATTTTTGGRICSCCGTDGSALYHNDGGGRFSDVTAAAGLPPYPFLPGAARVGRRRSRRRPRSRDRRLGSGGRARGHGTGSSTCHRRTSPARSSCCATTATARSPTSRRRRARRGWRTPSPSCRPTSTTAATSTCSSSIATGRRCCSRTCATARFATSPRAPGSADIVGAIRVTAVAAGDVNKDDFPDFFFGRRNGGVFALSDGRGRFSREPAPDGAAGALRRSWSTTTTTACSIC